MQRKYESMIVLAPTFSEDESKAESQKIHAMIEKYGGEIVETEEWGKKKLAYEIRKFQEGYFFIIYYLLDPAKVSELESNFTISENLIRYNILVKQ